MAGENILAVLGPAVAQDMPAPMPHAGGMMSEMDDNPAFILVDWVRETYLRLLKGGLPLRRPGRIRGSAVLGTCIDYVCTCPIGDLLMQPPSFAVL
jgi:hypothetical protein